MGAKASGDYLYFDVDWSSKEMSLMEAGGVLKGQIDQGTMPLCPLTYALKLLSKDSAAVNYVIDVKYDGGKLWLGLHCTNDFNSVVNVPRAQVEAALRGLLTPRETEIAALLFEGYTIRYIACMLRIAEGTVKRTIYNIHQKMGVGGQVDLVREIYARLAQTSQPAD